MAMWNAKDGDPPIIFGIVLMGCVVTSLCATLNFLQWKARENRPLQKTEEAVREFTR